ncbi:unnamed protein product [Eruca vesicaria subsp. sativa]|uniref:GATA transcription factor 26 n=1 Tax=Eruca vesicaria subsp. sativa TaxID=29727 RepID=A0ABC8LSJ7_ERUVS|nr:unnamed protein product [Eruca vesicaria subsp. sativa]
MGKQGPCYHCGVTSTPLWRNGPPEKPVLCNACGSRWRTKGSLVNYTPLHSRADGEENQYQRMKSISVNYKNTETKKMLKRKAIQEPLLEFNYGFKKAVVEEDTSNRSSSGSAISNSESCAQFSSADGSELTGPSQSSAWETTVPCKRRTCVGRPKASSSVEKLTQDLYNILQEQQSSISIEDDLLFENEMLSMVSVEIGHGSVLMRNPAREEESEEASSLSSVENKSSSISDAYSHSVKRAEIETKRGSVSVGEAVKEEQLKRTGRVHVLGSHSSPLCSIDLKDVFNFDEFIEQFTEEEQKKLMRLLPQIDSVNLHESVRMMFESAQFKENFSFFQKLIADGVFEMPSTSEAKLEDIKSLKKLALSDFRKSRLVESYNFLKKGEKGSVTTTSRSSNPNAHKHIVTIKRRCENQTQSKSESRGLMRSPKSVTKMKASHESNNGSCFSQRSLASVFAQESGYEGSCSSSDQDLLLLDLPSNGTFPQAELLHQL